MKETSTYILIVFSVTFFMFFIILTGCSELQNSGNSPGEIKGCKAGECHASTVLRQYPPDTGFHTAHISSLHHDLNCTDCHNGYENEEIHNNGFINGYNPLLKEQETGSIVIFDEIKNPGAAWDDSSGTCSNTGCHSSQGTLDWYGAVSSFKCSDCHTPGNHVVLECFDCHTPGSHAVHVTANSRGPAVPLVCTDCHVDENFPLFEDGKDLTQTGVCDNCHSPGGSYNGVMSTAGSVGAKDNWINGVYEGDILRSGKEKWCAGCHDDVPSVIDGITAPGVIGNETGTSLYGTTGYGFYKTGHGIPSTEKEVWTGATGRDGAGLNCDACHDFSLKHIDAKERSFDCNSSASETCDADEYRTGYRLKLVDGNNPLRVPLAQNTGLVAEHFRLCFQAGCHSSGPYIDSGNTNTNFYDTAEAIPNRHYFHLNMGSGSSPLREVTYPDWRTPVSTQFPNTLPPGFPDGTVMGRMTCITCHDVHGTKSLSMIRQGLQVAYYNASSVAPVCAPPWNPPSPSDLTLNLSTGTMWVGDTRNLCYDCHGNACWNKTYERNPFSE